MLFRSAMAFAKSEASVLEVESGKAEASRKLLIWRTPSQSAGDHQVDDDEQIAFHAEDDALSDSTNLSQPLPRDRLERWFDGSEHEWRTEPYPTKYPA